MVGLMDKLVNGKPRVAATGVAGAIATLLIWYWNTSLHPMPDPLHLGTAQIGCVITLVTWLIGPLLRLIDQGPDQRQVDATARKVLSLLEEDKKQPPTRRKR